MNPSRDDNEIICRAKSRLMRVLHVTEPQAYWLVRQMAMIRRCNKGEIARLLLIFPDEDGMAGSGPCPSSGFGGLAKCAGETGRRPIGKGQAAAGARRIAKRKRLRPNLLRPFGRDVPSVRCPLAANGRDRTALAYHERMLPPWYEAVSNTTNTRTKRSQDCARLPINPATNTQTSTFASFSFRLAPML